jgi:hypothetical protein
VVDFGIGGIMIKEILEFGFGVFIGFILGMVFWPIVFVWVMGG